MKSYALETTWGEFKKLAPVRRPYLDMPLLYLSDMSTLAVPCVLMHEQMALINVNRETVNMVITRPGGTEIGLLDYSIVGFTIGYNDSGDPGITINGQTVIGSLTAARYAGVRTHHEMEALSPEALWDIVKMDSTRTSRTIIDFMKREGTKYTAYSLKGG